MGSNNTTPRINMEYKPGDHILITFTQQDATYIGITTINYDNPRPEEDVWVWAYLPELDITTFFNKKIVTKITKQEYLARMI